MNRIKLYIMIIAFLLLIQPGYAYEVPLKTQIDNSCATTSIMMVMDTWNESHSQTFWDICAEPKDDEAHYNHKRKGLII